MKRLKLIRSTFVSALGGAALLSMANLTNAAVLDENTLAGNISGNSSFRDTNLFGAENFELLAESTIEELVIFGGITTNSPQPATVNWRIHNDAGLVPGSLVSSGTNAASFTDTGNNLDCCDAFNIFSISVDIPDVVLNPDQYWVAFNVVTPDFISWADNTNGDNRVAQSFDGGVTWSSGYGASDGVKDRARTFQVLGTPTPPPVVVSAVPIPAALPLYLSALVGLGFIAKRRHRAS